MPNLSIKSHFLFKNKEGRFRSQIYMINAVLLILMRFYQIHGKDCYDSGPDSFMV